MTLSYERRPALLGPHGKPIHGYRCERCECDHSHDPDDLTVLDAGGVLVALCEEHAQDMLADPASEAVRTSHKPADVAGYAEPRDESPWEMPTW